MADEPTTHPIARTPPAGPAAVSLRPATSGRSADRKSGARRFASIGRRWFRETFSREQLLSSLRSLVWVAPLTVLIWIYAEREQVEEKTAQFPVEVRSGAPGQVARLPDGRGVTVMAKLSGPKAKVGQAIDALQAGAPVQIFVGAGRQPGLHDIDIIPLIQGDPRLRESGVTIVSGTPPLLRVELDALREEALDVRLNPEAARLLNGPAVFDPPKVRVSAPAAAFAAAFERAKGPLYVEADLPQEMRTPGRHGPTSVRVSVPGLTGPDVSLRLSSVMATVDVRDADERTEIKTPVPITMDVTQEIADGYKISYEPRFVVNVPVFGQPDRIKRLKNNELLPKPSAWFTVTSADALAGGGTKRLEYRLPDGITMHDQDVQQVTFKVVPREGGQ
jgi:hypothetical protein